MAEISFLGAIAVTASPAVDGDFELDSYSFSDGRPLLYFIIFASQIRDSQQKSNLFFIAADCNFERRRYVTPKIGYGENVAF